MEKFLKKIILFATLFLCQRNTAQTVSATDTASMLSPYLRTVYATAQFQPLENQRLSTNSSPSYVGLSLSGRLTGDNAIFTATNGFYNFYIGSTAAGDSYVSLGSRPNNPSIQGSNASFTTMRPLSIQADGSYTIVGATSASNHASETFQVVGPSYFTTTATFGGKVIANNGFTDGYTTFSGAQINRIDGYVELQWLGANGVRLFGGSANPVTFGSNGSINVQSLTATSGAFNGILSASKATFTNYTSSPNLTITGNDQSNVRINLNNIGTGGSNYSILSGNPGASNAGFSIYDEANSVRRMYIDASGNSTFSGSINSPAATFNNTLYVGAITPLQAGSYSLAVNGSAIFNKAVVKSYGNWSDYVFDKEYKLPKLSELENFINANHHLPEIPSSREIERDGIDLGNNQSLLLKKIEEITLLLIDQSKKMALQNGKIEMLEKNIVELKNKIELNEK